MKMKLLAAVAVAVALCVAGTAAAGHLTQVEGTWKLVSAERDGKPVPKEEFDKDVTVTCTVKGDTVKIVAKKGDKVTTEATAKLAKKGDKYDQYDVTYTKGRTNEVDLKGKTLRGIIQVEGDTMKVCWHGAEGYPKEFKTAKESGCASRTYKRVKE